MNRYFVLTMASATLAASVVSDVSAAEGPWMVRVRAVDLQMSNKSEPIPALAVPGDAIKVSNKIIPEVDFSYFFSPSLAAELILTYPQKHDVDFSSSAVGAFRAGSFKHLPPTLTLQYHFLPDAQFRPYLGAGLNYTRISGVNLSVPGVTGLHLDNDSVGGALQAGFDVKLANSMYFNFDIKKIYINSDVTNDAGARITKVKLDPLAVSVGVGWRF